MTKKSINKVYVVYKQSVFQKYIIQEKNRHLNKMMKYHHPLIRDILTAHERHQRGLDLVQRTLEKHKIKYKMVARSHLKTLKGYELIITVGGDGTFLRTSHYITNQYLLGINSAPSLSVGALCSYHINEFETKITSILERKFDYKTMHRMTIKINNKKLPIEPVNDVLFTNYSPAATSRYLISKEKLKEEHKSSGVWICTASGSSAAINAAGGQIQDPNDNRLQYLTREPYQGIYTPYQLTRGFLKKGHKLNITSKMIKSRIYFDGPTRFFTLEYGDKITVSLSSNFLKVII